MQINKIVEIVRDFHWMARRYADNRQSYIAYQFNEHVRALQMMGIDLNPTDDGTVWARDARGRALDGLSEQEASMGAFSAPKAET